MTMPRRRAALAAATALACLATIAAPAHARPMTAEDLATFARVAAPAPSPDGRWVVYQQTDTNAESYARTTGLWVADTANEGVAPRRIADLADANENSPA